MRVLGPDGRLGARQGSASPHRRRPATRISSATFPGASEHTRSAGGFSLPALWIFAERVSQWGAVILGIGFLLARAEYARGYILSPEGAHAGRAGRASRSTAYW